ncbi:hypothetical protein FJY90_03075 [Candidatus Gottesmanbacteria bacterium]|nr:hypothetical protein [Candidatus Poribacteria bacterium]MBM3283213.1 hypothetical protein [Candidatus Gottesmanbacteria bacterium]
MKYFDLDSEEKQILSDFEKNEFVSLEDVKREKRRYKNYVRETLRKTRNINIRLSQKDLLKLKSRAIAQGIPYQTLVASVLHRFASTNSI